VIFSIEDGLLTESQAQLSLQSESLQFGYGLFETMKAVKSRVFLLKQHIQRLIISAEKIGLPIEKTGQEIETFVNNALQQIPNSHHRIKLLLIKEGLFLICSELSKGFQKESIRLYPYKASRSIPEIKSLNYMDCQIAFSRAEHEGFDDALLYKKIITEASRGNLFWVQNKQLFTTTKNALPGITQNFIMDHWPSVTTTQISLKQLLDADEVFYTNSIQGVCPVTQIGNVQFEIGTLTIEIQAFYKSAEFQSEQSS